MDRAILPQPSYGTFTFNAFGGREFSEPFQSSALTKNLSGEICLRPTRFLLFLFSFIILALVLAAAQNQPAVDPSLPPPPHEKKIHLKHVLVVGQTKGFEHDSVPDGMAAIYNMGHDTGLWEATLRTDTELITKKTLDRNAKNLDYFDAIVFVSTTGELDLDDAQKKDMMSFIKDDGKGFVGVHAALDTNYKWPEYGEMIGGWFDQHPWFTFNAPIINEDPSFPAVRHFPAAFVKYDEIYQPKEWSRDKVHVLLSLDPTKLNYENNPRIHRNGSRFCRSVGQNVRQGSSLLFDTGPHAGVVERS